MNRPLAPPPRPRDLARTTLAALLVGSAFIVWGVLAVQREAGDQVPLGSWLVVPAFLVGAVVTYRWDRVWRLLHPPVRFDPATLPAPFDWGEIARRVWAHEDFEEPAQTPEESDSVYSIIHDVVEMEYVDAVRTILSSYDGSVTPHPTATELGTDRSGRTYFVSSLQAWTLEPPVVLPSPGRIGLVLVDRIDAVSRLREDVPWNWTVLHARDVDRLSGEVARTRQELYTAPGVSDHFGPRTVLGA